MKIYGIITFVLLIFVSIYLFIILNELKNVVTQINKIWNQETNREIVLNSRNPIIVRLAREINLIIAKQKKSRLDMQIATRQLDTAINNISHDLRTPLTVASGYTQYILENNLDKNEQNALLSNTLTNLKSVEEKLEDLLEYNRLNEDRIVLNLEKINLSRVLQEKTLSMYESFISKNIELKLDIQSNVFGIYDKKCIDRIFQNVLGNILCHAKDEGEIRLYLSDKKIIFEAKNKTTKSIKHPEKLADRFYTEDLSRQDKNAGLGLYIVKELVQIQSGTLDINTSDDIFNIKIKLG